MVGRNQNNGRGASKRPSQTLDLEAAEIQESDAPETIRASEETGVDGRGDETRPETSAIDAAFASEAGEDNKGDGLSQSGVHSQDGSHSQQGFARGSLFKTALLVLTAGVVGGVMALAGQQFMPRLVTQGDLLTLEKLNGKLSALEGKIQPGKLDELNQKFQEMSTNLKSKSAEGSGALQDRLETMEATLADLAKVAKVGDERIEGLAALATKMNGIEGRVATEIGTLKGQISQELRREVSELSKVVAAQESLAQIEGVKLSGRELSKRLAVFEAQLKQLEADLGLLGQSVEKVRSETASKNQLSAEISGLKTTLGVITGEMANLKRLEQEAHETARRSALTLAFSNLKRAMEQGSAYIDELATVKRLSRNEVDLKTDFALLESLSSTGLSSEQDLMQSFPEIAGEAIAAETEIEDASTWSKVVSKARSTFRYRRTGDVAGNNAEAVLARMEHKFKNGQLEAVISEAKVLSPKAARVVAPWLKKLQARLMVEQAMMKLDDKLLTSLQPSQ